tara:strand:+ start:362 stop:580 length:219 start_codon:yes stop_codon:yes gene_type:complete
MEYRTKNKFHAGDIIKYNLSAWKIIGTEFVQGLVVKVEVASKNERRYHVLNNKKVVIINDKIYQIKPFLTGE